MMKMEAIKKIDELKRSIERLKNGQDCATEKTI